MGRYNEIVTSLKGNSDAFDPIFWEGPEGEVIASDWAGGFLDAVALRSGAWRPLFDDDGAKQLMAPMFMLAGDITITEDLTDEDELMAAAAEMIPECIANIRAFWLSIQGPSLH